VTIAIIAAHDRKRGIGKDGKLPWHISEDLRRFKKLTMGHAVVMGRKTWQSLGKPLTGRRNVVLSTGPLNGVEVYRSIDDLLEALKDEERIFVIGGGEVYRQFLGRADELYLTIVDRETDADTFFPPYEQLIGSTYSCVGTESHDGFSFADYRRS
jgi:dihydrofolate reductase